MTDKELRLVAKLHVACEELLLFAQLCASVEDSPEAEGRRIAAIELGREAIHDAERHRHRPAKARKRRKRTARKEHQ